MSPRPQAPGGGSPSYTDQDFTAWFTDYPSTHRLAGQTVEVVPRSALVAEREARKRLEAALRVAADDLGKAANQFASMRESQRAGHTPEIVSNPEKFEEKEALARASLSAVPEKCGRLLVGQGTDTWDPLCQLPKGHEGACSPGSGEKGRGE